MRGNGRSGDDVGDVGDGGDVGEGGDGGEGGRSRIIGGGCSSRGVTTGGSDGSSVSRCIGGDGGDVGKGELRFP